MFVCSLDPTVTDENTVEMWHNVAALLVLSCGAILIVTCLVKYGLRQWKDTTGEVGLGTTEAASAENLGAVEKGNRHFVEIHDHQSINEPPGDCEDQCHCCHECQNQRVHKRTRNPKRMSNIESKIMRKKSRDSQEMTQ